MNSRIYRESNTQHFSGDAMGKKRKSTKVKLKFANDRRGYYVPSDFQKIGEEDLQKLKNEYTRLRDIARKRINRLEEQGLLYSSDIERFRNMIPKISEMENPNIDIRFALSDVSRLLNKEASTIPKAKKEMENRKKQFEEFVEKASEQPKSDEYNFDWFETDENDYYEERKKRGSNYKYAERIRKMRDLDDETWWEFVSFTKYLMNDNVYYWTLSEINYLFMVDEVFEKLKQHDFFGAYTECTSQS